MHIPSTSFDETILKGNGAFLANALLERLNPETWPFTISQLPSDTALVGGAIRDAFLNRLKDKPDLDFVLPQDAIQTTHNLAKKLGGKVVVLDAERDIARLVFQGWTIDLARQIGCNLEKDLLRRDYRVNSIALKLGPDPTILDPTGGIEDLRKKRLVAVSEENLVEDPLRLLRGLRLMAELNFFLDAETRTFINTHATLLRKAAPERIQSELQRLVDADGAENVITLLKDSGLLGAWSNHNPTYLGSVPTAKALKIFTAKELSLAMPLARLTNLLSDSGLLNLRFSRKQRQRCQLLRKWQLRNDGNAYETLNEEDRLQLHMDLVEDLPALILTLSKKDQEEWINRWRDLNDPLFHPCSPLDGNTLQQILDLPEGPYLGELKHHLCLEKAFGRLNNIDKAFQEARQWRKHNSTLL
tara:strand:- start:1481 stop:2725 length:1245 start_codon:yes stop_codon:yes gene_type:complete